MKNNLLLLLLLSVFCFSANAQDKKEEAANYAADYICNCVNKVYSDIEPEVRTMLIKIYTLPLEEQMNYVLGLTEDMQTPCCPHRSDTIGD